MSRDRLLTADTGIWQASDRDRRLPEVGAIKTSLQQQRQLSKFSSWSGFMTS